jgi:signal transduction histidine kinase
MDPGNGIDPKIINKIFDPLFTTKFVRNGIGPGLSISYYIIQEHGGAIECNSKMGEGTKVIIELPIN